MDKQGKMTLFCVLHFKNDVLTYYFGVCSPYFLASAFQDHPTFGYMVEAIYKSILFLSFVKGSWRMEEREDVFDDRRERDVPSLKKECKVLQVEDRKQGLQGKGWLGVSCHLDIRYQAF